MLTMQTDRQMLLLKMQLGTALVMIAAGTALLPLKMVGLLGFPLMMIGFPLCVYTAYTLSRTGRPRFVGHLVGSLLTVIGIGAVMLSCAYTSSQVHWYLLARQRSLTVVPWAYIVIPVYWALAAALTTAGIRLRCGTPLDSAFVTWLTFTAVGAVTALGALLCGLQFSLLM